MRHCFCYFVTAPSAMCVSLPPPLVDCLCHTLYLSQCLGHFFTTSATLSFCICQCVRVKRPSSLSVRSQWVCQSWTAFVTQCTCLNTFVTPAVAMRLSVPLSLCYCFLQGICLNAPVTSAVTLYLSAIRGGLKSPFASSRRRHRAEAY